MAIGLLRHSCRLCGFDHHFRAHVDGHGVFTQGRSAEPRLGDGYGIWGQPYGWMVYLCLLHGKSQTKMDRSSFSHMFTGLVEGKNETGKPYISHGENHGFQLSDSLQQSEHIWKL